MLPHCGLIVLGFQRTTETHVPNRAARIQARIPCRWQIALPFRQSVRARLPSRDWTGHEINLGIEDAVDLVDRIARDSVDQYSEVRFRGRSGNSHGDGSDSHYDKHESGSEIHPRSSAATDHAQRRCAKKACAANAGIEEVTSEPRHCGIGRSGVHCGLYSLTCRDPY